MKFPHYKFERHKGAPRWSSWLPKKNSDIWTVEAALVRRYRYLGDRNMPEIIRVITSEIGDDEYWKLPDDRFDCYVFANLVRDIKPEATMVGIGTASTDNYHSFVRYRGKYYDSLTPNGVSQWEKLGFFKRYGLPDDWELVRGVLD